MIRSIPVHMDMSDVIGWHYDSKGRFSVRSAYKIHRAALARQQHRAGPGESESSNGKDDFWHKLWSLDCPPKVKHFLWRLGQNTLAVRRVLQRREMKIETSCCMCHRLYEDGGHLFLKCKEVKAVWRELNLEDVRCKLMEVNSAKK